MPLQTEAHQPHAKQSLRLWLRLLATTRVVEKAVRAHLRAECDSTLPRFDVLATLARAPSGMTMSELSSRILVSNGNVTGLVNRLEEDGLVVREADPRDRRSQFVTLTDTGRERFRRMAAEHEAFVDNAFADVSDADMERLLALIAGLNRAVHARLRPTGA